MIRALNTAGLSDLEKRVVKATYHDDDPPKQKHVEGRNSTIPLILLSADHELVPFLDRRLVSPLWNVCLKCLSLVHKLALEADERFLSELQSAPALLRSVPQHFDTSEDPTATAHSTFIHSYAAYLLAKVRSYGVLHVSCERQQPADSRRWVMRLKVATLVKALPLLQVQFDALLKVQPANSEDLNHPIPIALLERYESMTLPQTERMLQATHKFLAQNNRFRKWADKLARNGLVDRKLMPTFDAIPVTFLQLLEEHIVELGGVVSEPTPTPAAKQRSPRTPTADSARVTSPKQRTVNRRGNRGANEDVDIDEDEVGEEDERGRAARGSIERKRRSQVRVSGERRQQYVSEDVEDQQEEAQQEEDDVVTDRRRAQLPRRGSGGLGQVNSDSRGAQQQQQPAQQQRGRAARQSPAARHSATEADDGQQFDEDVDMPREDYKQPAPQQPTRSTQRPALNGRAPNQTTSRPTTSSPQRRTAQSPPQLYDDEQTVHEDESDLYDSPAPLSITRRVTRPATSARVAQLQPQRPAIQSKTASGQRSVQPTARHESHDEYYEEEGQQEVDEEAEGGSHVDAAAAADDPLALYMQSTTPLFASSSKQQPAQSVFSTPAASRIPSSSSAASRSAAKARVAAALSSELNLFDNFDPLTLHPAEQRALDRQQADMQAAFFTTPPITSSVASSLQPPPPAYEVEQYETSEEGGDQPVEQRTPAQPQPATDLFSDLTARLNIDDSDHPPALPMAAAARPAARPPAGKSAISRSVPAPSNSQRPITNIRVVQQSRPRPKQRQPLPVVSYEDEADELEGSEPNFL